MTHAAHSHAALDGMERRAPILAPDATSLRAQVVFALADWKRLDAFALQARDAWAAVWPGTMAAVAQARAANSGDADFRAALAHLAARQAGSDTLWRIYKRARHRAEAAGAHWRRISTEGGR